MSGQRIPKRKHPKEMCFQCQAWVCKALDFGNCYYPNKLGDLIDQGEKYAYEKACYLFWPNYSDNNLKDYIKDDHKLC